MSKQYEEVEVRFLEIDKEQLIEKLHALNAEDGGEDLLDEIIIYDKEFRWRDVEHKLLRLRTQGGKTMLSYKHHKEQAADGTEEIELEVSDKEAMVAMLERIGFVAYRRQQKRRHTFRLGSVTVDIDTWPQVPTYVEFEGPDEPALKAVAKQLGFNWAEVVFKNPRTVIEEVYGIPVRKMTHFTFERFE